jgi:hypothetical protein
MDLRTPDEQNPRRNRMTRLVRVRKGVKVTTSVLFTTRTPCRIDIELEATGTERVVPWAIK